MKKILIVDDDEDIVSLLENLLKIYNFESQVAWSGEEALKKSQNHPDLILLDIGLAGVHGFHVLEELKKNPETRSIPVVVVSSFNKQEQIREAKSLGAADYVTKPFDIADLVARIKKFI